MASKARSNPEEILQPMQQLPGVSQELPGPAVADSAEPSVPTVADIPQQADPEPPRLEPEVAHVPGITGISCPICGSQACSFAGGRRRCNQCGASWN